MAEASNKRKHAVFIEDSPIKRTTNEMISESAVQQTNGQKVKAILRYELRRSIYINTPHCVDEFFSRVTDGAIAKIRPLCDVKNSQGQMELSWATSDPKGEARHYDSLLAATKSITKWN